MRRHAIALLLAATITLPLSGCFGAFDPHDAVDSANDIANSATDFADQMTEMADALSSVEWNKISKLAVYDAQTGEQVAEITDQTAIETAFAGLSDVNGVAATPDAPAEYRAEIWQPTTITAGETEPSGEIKVLEVATYEGCDVVTMTVTPIGFTLSLTSPQTASALRELAG